MHEALIKGLVAAHDRMNMLEERIKFLEQKAKPPWPSRLNDVDPVIRNHMLSDSCNSFS